MGINKNSLAYRCTRNVYYALWRQNPLVYRLLLPLKLRSVQTNSGERSSIRFSPHRVQQVYLAPDLPRNMSDGQPAGTEDGDWEKHTIQISDTWIYECVRRFLQSPKRDAAELERLWAEGAPRMTRLDQILAETTGGPKRLTDMIATTITPLPASRPAADIFIRVGSQGQLLCEALASSVIALSAARLTDRSETEGIISFRHKSWEQIRQKFFVLAGSVFSEGHGALYQQLWHPDLMDVPHLHKQDDRAQFIEAAAGESQTGTALDIGANLGFFCHQLEDLGFRCHAIENNPILVDHMRLLRDIEGKTFKITCASILGHRIDMVCSQEYDLVLALAIFHHFLKKEQDYEALKRLLQNLKMKRMVLQTHNPRESQMRNAFRNFDPDAFADHIISLSCLTKRRFLGTTSEGRHVYLLS
jgi:hypothetical protein